MADSYSNRAGDKEEEEEEEELDDSNYKTIKDAVLFAIDVSKSMLQKPPQTDDKKADRDSATSAALKCAYQLMQQRIISNPKDMMGILLFGTEKTDFKDGNTSGDSYFPHCYLLQDLDCPAAEDVKQLRDLVENEEEARDLLVPTNDPTSISTVLFCANQIFTTKAPNFSSRRLFLVTDNDSPAHDKASKDVAVTRARDLNDLGVTIELFPISKPGGGFDKTKFYDDIVYSATLSDPDAPASLHSDTKVSKSGDGLSLLQSLLSQINSKAAPRRALFSLPMEIGPDLRIGVKGFILIKRQEPVRSCYVWVGGERPQIVTSATSHLADDTARVVEKTEVRKAYKFGGETITFTPEEFKQIRQCFGEPIIRIIGFKPLSMLPIWANTNKSTFIYPSESDYVGSTRLFSALQQKLLQDKKMALAWFIARRNAAPIILAIIPSEEKLDDDSEQVIPPGLWLVPLPFSDDIRQSPEQSSLTTTDELTDMMSKVIQQLLLPKGVYEPTRYPNPSLQWFYRILQAIALEEEVPEKPEPKDDKTIPKYRQIDKRAGPYIVDWGHALEAQFKKSHGNSHSTTGPKKRGPVPVEKEEKPSKRIKKEDGGAAEVDAMTNEQMAELNDKGHVSKQTVAVLRDFLAARKLDSKGKKPDLVSRVQDYLDSKGL